MSFSGFPLGRQQLEPLAIDLTPQPIGSADPGAPHASERKAQLEKLVAGMGRVVERARLLELCVPVRGGCAYAQKICEWIVENDAVDGAEILDNMEDLVKYSSMKSLSIKRFQKALVDEYAK